MRNLLISITVLAFFAFAQTSYAQVPQDFKALEDITEINRVKPAQNANYKQMKDMLSARVLDSKNRVIGQVNDLIVRRNGVVTTLNVDLDRLNLGVDELYLDYSDMGFQKVSNGFKTSLSDSDIEDLFPSLLSETKPASGNDKEHSARKLIGKKVQTQNGQMVGTVENIFFDSRGGHANLLQIRMSDIGVRGFPVAIPFEKAKYGTVVTITEPYYQAMQTYVNGD